MQNWRRYLLGLTLLCLAGVFLATGCARPAAPTGVVVSTKPPALLHYSQYAPRVTVMRPDGSEIRIGHVGGPFFVVGFVEPPAQDAGYFSPALAEMAGKLSLDGTAVIQITVPTELCKLTPQQQAASPMPRENLYRYFDPSKLAWKAYWRPDPGTVMLVDRQNLIPIINKRGKLNDPKSVQAMIDHAKQMQRQWNQNQGRLRS